jgi:hypothetical protein
MMLSGFAMFSMNVSGSNLVNPGFETGDLSGWTIDTASEFVGVVGVDTFYVHDDPSQPYTVYPGEGDYMLRLGSNSPWNSQPMGDNSVYQVFVASEPFVRFAYNIFTYDWQGYNFFSYKLTFASNDTIIYSYDQTAWGTWGDTSLKHTGWKTVSLDVSKHIGETLKLWISGGGTSDNYYRTWVYIDSLPGSEPISVTTYAEVAGGDSGSPPDIKCKWETPDDDPGDGIQIAPILGGEKQVFYYAIVTDPQGVDTISAVYADIWHPDGEFKYQIELDTIIKGSEAISIFEDAWDDGIVTVNDAYYYGWSDDDIYNDIIDELNEGLAYLYKGYSYLDYCQPAGWYHVGIRAVDNYAEWSDYLCNHFWYIPTAGIEIDFSSIDYGSAVISTTKWVGGDIDFGTGDKPTVRNIGNTPVELHVYQTDMGFGKTDGDWNVMFDARLGADGGISTYYPEEEAVLGDILDLCTTEKLDFSIHIYKGVPGYNYIGEMDIWATVHDWPEYDTPDNYVTTPPGGVPDYPPCCG